MICSTCANALIRKLEVNLDRGQRITCVVDGSVNLANIVECNQFRAMVVPIASERVSVSNPGIEEAYRARELVVRSTIEQVKRGRGRPRK